MKVKLLKTGAWEYNNKINLHKLGESVDAPSSIAKKMISDGYAEKAANKKEKPSDNPEKEKVEIEDKSLSKENLEISDKSLKVDLMDKVIRRKKDKKFKKNKDN